MRKVTRRRNPVLLRVRRDRTIAAAQEGLLAAWEHAADPWKQAALECLLWVATFFPTVTSEDVWARLETKFPDVETHENSAMGGVFTTAAARGWIVSTGRRKQSTRETNHREITIWSSNLYLGANAVDVATCAHCEGHGTVLSTVDRSEPQEIATPRPMPPPTDLAASDREIAQHVKKPRGRAQSKAAPPRPSRPALTEEQREAKQEEALRREEERILATTGR